MPTQAQRREATRHAVVQAAIAAFSRSGVGAVSLDEVAQRADVAKATLLYHFGSRTGLLEAVAVELIKRFEERLARQVADTDLEGWVRAVLTEQCTARGRVLYGIDAELADAGNLGESDPMPYLIARLTDLGLAARSEVTAAAMMQYGRMLAHGQRSQADVAAITATLLQSL